MQTVSSMVERMAGSLDNRKVEKLVELSDIGKDTEMVWQTVVRWASLWGAAKAVC